MLRVSHSVPSYETFSHVLRIAAGSAVSISWALGIKLAGGILSLALGGGGCVMLASFFDMVVY